MKHFKLLLIAAILVGIAIAISLFTDSRSREYEAKYENCLDKVSLLEKEVSKLRDSINYYRTQLQEEKRKSLRIPSHERALAVFERALPELIRGEELERWVHDHRDVYERMNLEHRMLINRVIYGHPTKKVKMLSPMEKREVFLQYERLHRKGMIRKIEDFRRVTEFWE